MKKFILPTLLFLLFLPIVAVAQLTLYKGGVNQFSIGEASNCQINTTTQDSPYEGTEHYKFTYKTPTPAPAYSAFRFDFNSGKIDFTAYTHFRIAYKGGVPGYPFLFVLKNATGDSKEIALPYSANYTVVDIPITKFYDPCAPYNMKAIQALWCYVSFYSPNGVIYFDAVELINKTSIEIDGDPRPSVEALPKTWDRIKNVGTGLNLNRYDGKLNVVPYTKQEIANLAEMNVKIIRLALGLETMTDTIAPFALKTNHPSFVQIDSVIKWTGQYNIKLILDNHIGYETDDNIGKAYWGNNSVQKDTKRLTAMWAQLSTKYKNIDYNRVFFELKNEPGINGNGLTNNNLRKINNAMIDTIRKYDTERTLIVTASGVSTIDSLESTRPYSDNNLIYTFHNYDPFAFTYQGQTWICTDAEVAFNQSEEATLACNMKRIKEWSKKYNVPIFDGEFGVTGKADKDYRYRYIKSYGAILDSLNIPATYWDPVNYYYGFGFLRNKAFHKDNQLRYFAEALHYTLPKPLPTTQPLYKNGFNDFDGQYTHNTSIQEVMTDAPYEGGQHFKYECTAIAQNDWRSGRLELHNPWINTYDPPLDFTEGNYTHFRIAYKGMSPGQTLNLTLSYRYTTCSAAGYVDKDSKTITLGGSSTNYTVIDIPLDDFIDNDFRGVWHVSFMNLDVFPKTEASTVFIDNIELVNKKSTFPVGLPACLEDDYLELEKLYKATNGATWTDNTNWLTSPDMKTWKGITLTADGCDVKNIDLRENKLSGTLPDMVLPQLEQFYTPYNAIGGTLPTFTTPKLNSLWLAHNKLEGTVPNFSFPNLTLLYISHNYFKGQIPNFNLPKLEDLRISGCAMTGTIPNFNLPALQLLNLSDNPNLETTIPDFSLPNLMDFEASGCRLKGNVPNFAATKLNTPTGIIELENNKFTFGNLEKRTWLSLAKAKYAPQDTLLPLQVNGNVISVNTGAVANQTYEWLKDGQSVLITSTNSYTISSSGMYSCKVRHNDITVPASIDKNLILLTENKNVTYAVSFPAGLPTCLEDDYLQLEKLYKATNGAAWMDKTNWLTSPNMATWKGVFLTADGCDVKKIDLSSNKLVGTLPDIALPQLEQFWAAYNTISGTIPTFTTPKLMDLWLHQNKLEGTVPNFNLPNLKILYLSYNYLKGQIPNFNFPNLQDFRIRGCAMTGTIPNFNLPALQYLYLSDNPDLETTIPDFSMLPNLIDFKASACKLKGNVPNFAATKLNTPTGVIEIQNNKFTFDNLEKRTWLTFASTKYAPQDTLLPLQVNGNIISVNTGTATTSQTYEWLKDGQSIIITSTNTYTISSSGMYSCNVRHNDITVPAIAAKDLILLTESKNVTYTSGPALLLSTTAQNIKCFGDKTGVATAVAAGGIGNFMYLWSNGATTATIQNLAAGPYMVTATSGAATQIATVTISQPNDIIASFTVVNAKVGQKDGSISLTLTGGTAPYTFQWSNALGTKIATTQNLNSVGADAYSCLITDAAGCAKVITVLVAIINAATDLERDTQVSLYPNPTKDAFFVTFSKQYPQAHLTLLDATGKKVIEQTIYAGQAIEIATLTTGWYLAKIKIGETVVYKKVTKL